MQACNLHICLKPPTFVQPLRPLPIPLSSSAGYSAFVQQDALDASVVAALRAASELVLKDAGAMALTCFVRPVRPPPLHQPDAAQRCAQLPAWCKRALGMPFTQVRCLASVCA